MFRIPEPARLLTPRRTGVAAACLAMTALVAGCGGGDRVKPFQPTQIIAFGDETSAFDDTATTATPLVDFRSDSGAPMTNGPASTADVPYRARYTINLVGDVSFLCKIQAPDEKVTAACYSMPDAPNSVPVGASDFPTDDSFFVTQSTVYGYRVESNIIPLLNEVNTGAFNDATTSPPPAIYRTTDHAYYCSTDWGNDYGNWVQRLAHGLGGSGLSLGGTAGCAQDLGNGRSYAAWGAKVDDVDVQVSTNLGVLRDGVLVTMLAGQNDIMAAFLNVSATPANHDAAHRLMRDKGAQLARIINRIVATGARVVYLTVPDMGGAPAAIANPALATSLTHAFNEGYKGIGEGNESGGLVLSVTNNGHKIVKVDGYNQIAALSLSYGAVPACESDPTKVKMPNGVAVSTVLDAVYPGQRLSSTPSAPYLDAKAKAVLLNCRSNNLEVTTERNLGATPPVDEVRRYYGDYLWADKERLAPAGHAALANLAVARIRDQL